MTSDKEPRGCFSMDYDDEKEPTHRHAPPYHDTVSAVRAPKSCVERHDAGPADAGSSVRHRYADDASHFPGSHMERDATRDERKSPEPMQSPPADDGDLAGMFVPFFGSVGRQALVRCAGHDTITLRDCRLAYRFLGREILKRKYSIFGILESIIRSPSLSANAVYVIMFHLQTLLLTFANRTDMPDAADDGDIWPYIAHRYCRRTSECPVMPLPEPQEMLDNLSMPLDFVVESMLATRPPYTVSPDSPFYDERFA